MISTRSGVLVIDTVVCLTLAKWETVSGHFGGYLTKKDAKKKPEKDSDPAKDRGSPHAQLEGAPRPPKDIGGGF